MKHCTAKKVCLRCSGKTALKLGLTVEFLNDVPLKGQVAS